MEPTCFGGLALAAKAAVGVCIGVLSTGGLTSFDERSVFERKIAPYEIVAPSDPLIAPTPAQEVSVPKDATRRNRARKGALLIGLALAGEGDSRGLGLALTATAVP